MNYIFHKDVFLIDQIYNTLVKEDEVTTWQNKIYHFAGARKPWNTYCGIYTHLYCNYLSKTPWFNGDYLSRLYEQFDKKTKWLENFYQRTNYCKIVLFGADYLGKKLVRKLNLTDERIYFVDNDQEKWNEEIENISIFSPQLLLTKKENCKIIIALIIHYSEIKNWLIQIGYKENIDFF